MIADAPGRPLAGEDETTFVPLEEASSPTAGSPTKGARRRRWASLGVLVGFWILGTLTAAGLWALEGENPIPATGSAMAGLALLVAALVAAKAALQVPLFEEDQAWGMLAGALIAGLFALGAAEDLPSCGGFLCPSLLFIFLISTVLGPVLGLPLSARIWTDTSTLARGPRYAWRIGALIAVLPLTFLWGAAVVEALGEGDEGFLVGAAIGLVVVALPGLVLASRVRRDWLEGGSGTFRSIVAFVATFAAISLAFVLYEAIGLA